MQTEKQQVAEAALSFVPENEIIGVGSGSTVECFITALSRIKHRIKGAVASSLRTETLLKEHHIPIYDLNEVGEFSVYIDGADEINPNLQMIKGGGGALTREKILARSAAQFVCIVDKSKYVQALGSFPIAVEVLPMARSLVARELLKMGGEPVYRQGFTSDNGNVILDVRRFKIHEPIALEEAINRLVGVVENGLFAKRPADIALVAEKGSVRVIKQV